MATENRRESSVPGGLGTPNLIVVGSSVLTIVAVFLPWVEIGMIGQSASANGLDMLDANPLFSGAVTIALSLVAIGLAVGASDRPNARTGEVMIGVIVAAVGAMFFVSPSSALGAQSNAGIAVANNLVEPTFGVFATILGGIGMMIGGLAGYYG